MALFCLSLFIWLCVSPAVATAEPAALTLTVNSTVDEVDANPGDGQCVSTPSGACTLRAAVQEANVSPGTDSIVLPAGTFALTIDGRTEDGAATGDLDVRESVDISGAGAAATIVDGAGLDRLLDVFGPAAATVSGLMLQNGDCGDGLGPTYSGGGVRVNNGSSLTLSAAALHANRAGDSAGGLFNNGGQVVLNETAVTGNQAAYVGGVRSTGTLTLNRSLVSDNQATYYGGGVHSSAGLTLQASTVSANTAGTNGGGVYITLGTAVLENSTISGNRANGGTGGGVWIYYQAEVTVRNTTIAANGPGGGLFNYHEEALTAAGQEGNIRFTNTLIAGNRFANCGRSPSSPPIVSLGHNLDSGDSCELTQASDLHNVDAQLGPLAANGGPTPTQALLAGSPAVDAGDDAACPTLDQRGVPRPQGSHCDIGAYEFDNSTTPVADLRLEKTADATTVAPGAAVAYTLTAANDGPDEATAVVVTDTLPAGVDFVAVSGAGWDCSEANGEVTCTRPLLAPGATSAIVIDALAPGQNGAVTNAAQISAATFDVRLDNNQDTARIIVEGLELCLPLILRP